MGSGEWEGRRSGLCRVGRRSGPVVWAGKLRRRDSQCAAASPDGGAASVVLGASAEGGSPPRPPSERALFLSIKARNYKKVVKIRA